MVRNIPDPSTSTVQLGQSKNAAHQKKQFFLLVFQKGLKTTQEIPSTINSKKLATLKLTGLLQTEWKTETF